ncbi:MAG: hypothetical protein ABFD16_19895 [Thermoguttaceae bacterium]
MTTDQPNPAGRDRRRGWRFAAVHLQSDSVFLVGRKEIRARIVDESSGGFCILIGEESGVEVDAVVRLRTKMGCYEVRVANVQRVGNDDPQPDEGQSLAYRLGLQRLRELEVSPPVMEKVSWLAMYQHVMPGGAMVGVLIFILAVVIAAPLTAVGVMFGWDKLGVEQLVDWPGSAGTHDNASSSPRPSRRFLPVERSSEEPGKPPAAATRDTSSPERPSQADLEQIRTMLAHSPGADALLLPEVASRLTLTPNQRQQLHELSRSTKQALDQLDQRAKTASRQERTRKRDVLFGEARKQALRVLTSEQRARWESLQSGQMR